MVKEHNQTEEVNGKTERSGEENASVLTLSLHPGELIFFFCVCVFMKQLNVKSVSYHRLLASSCSAGVIKLCLAEAGVPGGKLQGIVKLLPAHCFSKSKDFFFFSIWLLGIPLFCQSPLPTTETESSTDEQEHMQHSPAEESQQSSKRKRTPVDIGSEEDLDIDGIHPSLHIYAPRVVHIEQSQCQERFNPSLLFKYIALKCFFFPRPSEFISF